MLNLLNMKQLILLAFVFANVAFASVSNAKLRNFDVSFDIDMYGNQMRDLAIRSFVDTEDFSSRKVIPVYHNSNYVLKNPYRELINLQHIDSNTTRLWFYKADATPVKTFQILEQISTQLHILKDIYSPISSDGSAEISYKVALHDYQGSEASADEIVSLYKLVNAIDHLEVGDSTILFGRSKRMKGYYADLSDFGNIRKIDDAIPYYEIRASLKSPEQTIKEFLDLFKNEPEDAIALLNKNINRRLTPSIVSKLMANEYLLNASDYAMRDPNFERRLDQIIKLYKSELASKFPQIQKNYIEMTRDPRFKNFLNVIKSSNYPLYQYLKNGIPQETRMPCYYLLTQIIKTKR